MRKRIFILLAALAVLCAVPSFAQENSQISEWEALWETEPWSTVTVQAYRDEPEAAAEYLHAFMAWHAGQARDLWGLPKEGQMSMEEAIEAALAAVINERGETEASLAHYTIDPSYSVRDFYVPLDEEEFQLEAPYWMIIFQGNGELEDGYYSAYFHPDTGELLIVHGDEVSYG